MSTPAVSENNLQYFQALTPRRGQYIDFSNSSEQSAAFYSAPDTDTKGAAAADKGTTIISLIADEDCWVSVGESPTAEKPAAEKTIVNSVFLPAGIKEFYGVKPGWKLAVIRDSADGQLYIEEGL